MSIQKLWGGWFIEMGVKYVDDFGVLISFDQLFVVEDIVGLLVYVKMLKKIGILFVVDVD